jgi:monothiol glutaredoxin
MSEVQSWIDNVVKSNDMVVFMKGTPDQPMCGFSGRVVQMLDYLGVPYQAVNVLESDQLRDGIKTYSDWPTIPQLYVKGEFIGGCDIVTEMFQSGELKQTLEQKGLQSASAGARPPPSLSLLPPGGRRRGLAPRLGEPCAPCTPEQLPFPANSD